MNEVKTFKAESMQEALAIVRREMGSDAVILSTRQVAHKRLLPFLKKRQEVEITAGTAVNHRPAALASVSSATTSQTTASPSALPQTPVPEPEPKPEPVPESDTPLSRAAALAKELERRNADKAQLKKSLSSLEAAASSTASLPTSGSGSPTAIGHEAPPSPHPDHAGGTSGPVESHQPSSDPLAQAAQKLAESGTQPANQAAGLQAAALARNDEGDSTHDLSAKLDALQKMVENLTQKAHFRGADEVPSELFEIYTQLIDADIDDDLARELVCTLRQNCSPEQLHDPVASRALLSAMVEADVRCANPIRTEPGRRRVVALVGPTGVGKTTTIAKLAANFRLRDGIRMGLVTVDTYRIAAVEQLRTYAEIIDLPMKVVTSPQEMRRALDELSDLDLILIDTAGRSPRDDLKIQELKSLIGEADVDEVHLVMSLTASVRSIRMTCEQFEAVNPTALILTKLDEAAGMGSLLSVSREVQLPFSYLTTGQDVPEDIEPANASRVSRLVLGEDRLFD